MNKQKKTVLISGISKGIGAGLAQRFVDLGYELIGTVRKEEHSYGLGKVFKLDLLSAESIAEVSSKLIEHASGIDLLINNAGIGSDYNSDLSLEENFELRFKTHLFGLYSFTEAVLPLINKYGKIINMSSKLSSFAEIDKVETEKLTPTKIAYITSKTSLNMYTKILAKQVAHRGIEVLSVHPGWVRTELSKTNKNAPLAIEDAVDGIVKLIQQSNPSGTFWDATSQKQLNW